MDVGDEGRRRACPRPLEGRLPRAGTSRAAAAHRPRLGLLFPLDFDSPTAQPANHPLVSFVSSLVSSSTLSHRALRTRQPWPPPSQPQSPAAPSRSGPFSLLPPPSARPSPLLSPGPPPLPPPPRPTPTSPLQAAPLPSPPSLSRGRSSAASSNSSSNSSRPYCSRFPRSRRHTAGSG